MPSEPPRSSGGPGDGAPSPTTNRLRQMVLDDPLLAAFERSRWPSRGPRTEIGLALAAPLTWMLAGNTAAAAASVIVVTALLLASAWLWSRDEGREARALRLVSRWTVVGFVWLGILTAFRPDAAQPHSRAPSPPAVQPETHLGVTPAPH